MGFFDWFKGKKPAEPKPTVRQDDSTSLGLSGGGWTNTVTGLGDFARDKVMQAQFIDSLRIPDPELAALYHGNDLAARIVEFKPKEMFRRGYQLVIPDPEDSGQNQYAEDAEAIEEYAAGIRVNEMFLDALIFGRLFGGTLLLIGADDGQDPEKPLNEERIKSVKYLSMIDRRFLFAKTYYSDPFDPKFGEVETYQVTNSFGDQQNSVVHESRVIRFDGAPVDILKKRQLMGWTLSVLQRPYDVLRQFEQTFQAASNLLVDSSQAVFKLKGLIEMISQGDSQTLQTRMQLVDMTRSAARAVLLDADSEDFRRESTSFAGIPDMIDRFMQRLASAADGGMPVTILFGRSPAGMNATGEADFRAFYDSIASEQKNRLQPLLLRLFKLICLAKDGPTGGKEPENGLEIHWNPLWQPTELEQAELEAKMATRDGIYIDKLVLLPEEVALSRFKTGKFSMETEIDVDARKKSMEAELDFSVQAAEHKAAVGPEQMIAGTPQEPTNPQLAPPGPGDDQ